MIDSHGSKKTTNFRWIVVFLLFFILIFNFIDRSAISFVLENLKVEYGLSETKLGLIIGSFSIGFLLTSFFGGIFLDKYGSKIVFIIMVLFWSISMFVNAFAASFIALLIARTLLGLAEGPTFPSLTMVTKTWLSEKERATSLSLIMLASTFGIAISGPIIATLITYLSWRGMFVVLGLVALVWVPIWIYLFKNNPKESKFVSEEELKYIESKNEHTVKEDDVLDSLSRKEVLKSILTSSTILSNMYAYVVVVFNFYFFVSWLPNYLFKVYGFSILNQGFATAIIWGTASVALFSSGFVFDYIYNKTGSLRFSRSYPMMLMNSISVICLLIILIYHNMPIPLLITLTAVAISAVMSVIPLYYVVNLDIVKKGTGLALGIMEATTGIAGFFIPVLTGYIVDVTNSFDYVFVLLITIGIIGVVVVSLFHKPDQSIYVSKQKN